MGLGRGVNIDLCLIMRIVALICCGVAVGLNVAELTFKNSPRMDLVSNSLLYGAGSYLIVLVYFLGWTIIQGEIEKTFAAIVLIFGFLWNLGAGIGVIIFKADYGDGVPTVHLVAGILSLVAGCVMLADGLHNLGVF